MNRLALLTLATVAFASPPAHADDYFLDGIFVANNAAGEATPQKQADLQVQCSLTPMINHKNGSFGEYYLDQLKFVATSEISYVKAREGTCSMDKTTQIETCHSTFFAAGQAQPAIENFNLYSTFTPQKIVGHGFDTMDALKKWQADGSKPDNETFAEYGCPDVTEAMVTSHASKDINPADEDATYKSLYYQSDPTPADLHLATSVLAALKK